MKPAGRKAALKKLYSGSENMTIADIMHTELITLDLLARDKEGAIKELIGLLAKAEIVTNEEGVFKAVMLRESEFSTGIGMGIAIPHAKCKWVARPAIAFGRCAESIPWTGEETTYVNLVFLIAVPEEAFNQHMKLIAQISRKLVHREIRERIFDASEAQSVIDVLNE